MNRSVDYESRVPFLHSKMRIPTKKKLIFKRTNNKWHPAMAPYGNKFSKCLPTPYFLLEVRTPIAKAIWGNKKTLLVLEVMLATLQWSWHRSFVSWVVAVFGVLALFTAFWLGCLEVDWIANQRSIWNYHLRVGKEIWWNLSRPVSMLMLVLRRARCAYTAISYVCRRLSDWVLTGIQILFHLLSFELKTRPLMFVHI